MSNWNYADVWEEVARVLPDSVAQIHGARRFTWTQFEQRANGLARALQEQGLSPEDRIAICLRNSPEYTETSHAALKLGIPQVNTNYRYTSDELRYLWDDADATVVVFHGSFTEQVEAVRSRASRVRCWIQVDDGAQACPDWALPYEQLLVRPTSRCAAVGPPRQRSVPALHRRYDRDAEGRHVAPGRPVPPGNLVGCHRRRARGTRAKRTWRSWTSGWRAVRA